MASFDFIDAATKGYEVVFGNIAYLARVAVPVVFMTVLCSLIMMLMGTEVSFMRRGLVMFPAFLVQGIYYAGLVRFVLYREPIHVWGVPVALPEKAAFPKQDHPYVQGRVSRAVAVQSGTVVYAIVCVVIFGVLGVLEHFAMMIEAMPKETLEQEAQNASPLVGFLILMPILGALLWALRLFALHLPFAMGFDGRRYLRTMGSGLGSSAALLGLFLICVLPLGVLLLPMMNMVLYLFKPVPSVIPVVMSVMQAMVDVLLWSIIVSGAAYGLNQRIREHENIS